MSYRCQICYLPIHEQKTLINCPRCQNEFHFDHIAAWLLNSDFCPVCRGHLSDSFRDEFKPKSERERRRLEQIFSTLDGLGELLQKVEKKSRHKRRIMAMREDEFGLSSNSMWDYIKIVIPFIILGAFVISLIALLSQS